jgi:AraC-like DNA-binding protein
MNIIDFTPLLGTFLGLFLSLFIFTKKAGLGRHKKIRFTLLFLILIITYTSFDFHQFLNSDKFHRFFGSDLFNHLIGFLLFYFVSQLTNKEISLKKWGGIILAYSIVRYILIIPYLQHDSLDEMLLDLASKKSNFILFVIVETVLVKGVNILLIILSYKKFVETQQYAIIFKRQDLYFKWVKIVFLLLVLLMLSQLFNGLVVLLDSSSNYDDFLFHAKLETLLGVLFFFTLIFSIMQIPVFVFTNEFEDLPEEIDETKKYKNSTLLDSKSLFNDIESLMKDEKIYLDQELKLNTISKKLNRPLRHISQCVNENAQVSFTDYVNQFRVELAKEKLSKQNPDTIFAIAIDVGFNSKANFYYAFKKQIGMTPTEYKKL